MTSGIYLRTEKTRKILSEAHKGKHQTQETKRKLSIFHKDIPLTQATKDAISWAKKGHIVSEETKKKLSETNKGKIRTEEEKRKISKTLKGRISPMKGRHHTQETKIKMSEAKKGKKSHNYGKHLTEETRRKISEAIKGVNHSLYGKHHTIETKRKISKALRGKKHWNWQDGISFEPYTKEFNNHLKELIRHRDSYQCQKCGCSELEETRKLSIHHIDYNKENCDPVNLISLCRSCNGKVNNNREKWSKYFTKRIQKIMDSNHLQLNFRFSREGEIKCL